MSLHVVQCRACGHQTYPARLWCPACGDDQARAAQVAVDYAEVIAWTVLPARAEAGRSGQAEQEGPLDKAAQPTQAASPEPPPGAAIIATARVLPSGPVLVLRLEELPTRLGQRLRLFERKTEGRALPWAWTLPD